MSRALLSGESEPVSTDDGPVLKDDVVAEPAEFADDRVGVGKEAMADVYMRIEDYMRKDDRVIAENAVVGDYGKGADVGVRADLCGRRDDGGRMNSGGVERGAVEEFKGAGEGQVGIRNAERSHGDIGKIRLYQDRRGAGCAGEGRVPGVRHEGNLAWDGFLDSRDAGNQRRRVGSRARTQFGAEELG
jgi:hypothetical protein